MYQCATRLGRFLLLGGCVATTLAGMSCDRSHDKVGSSSGETHLVVDADGAHASSLDVTRDESGSSFSAKDAAVQFSASDSATSQVSSSPAGTSQGVETSSGVASGAPSASVTHGQPSGDTSAAATQTSDDTDAAVTDEALAVQALSPDCRIDSLLQAAIRCGLSASCGEPGGQDARLPIRAECTVNEAAGADCRCITSRGLVTLEPLSADIATACSLAVNTCYEPKPLETACEVDTAEASVDGCAYQASCVTTVEGASAQGWTSFAFCSDEYYGDIPTGLRECTCGGLDTNMKVITSLPGVEETCSTVAGFCRGLRESAPPLGNCEQSDGLQSSFSCRREWRCVHLEGDFAFRRELAVECESLDEGSECTCLYSGLEATFEPLGAYANLATCDAALDTCMGLQAGWLL